MEVREGLLDLWVDSEHGRGATFSFSLPLVFTDEEQPDDEEQPERPPSE